MLCLERFPGTVSVGARPHMLVMKAVELDRISGRWMEPVIFPLYFYMDAVLSTVRPVTGFDAHTDVDARRRKQQESKKKKVKPSISKFKVKHTSRSSALIVTCPFHVAWIRIDQ